MKTKRTGRTTRVATAVCVALLASSCSGNDPGVAADVNGAAITDERVDSVADLLCELGGLAGQTDAGTPTRNARSRALELLINNELAFDLGSDVDLPQAALDSSVTQNQAARDVLPESMRDTFDEFVDEFARAQVTVQEVGRESLEESGGGASVSDDDAYAEGQRLRLELAEESDITIDPRFGTIEEGVVTPGSGSLSVPESDEAKQDAKLAPDMAAVEDMPAPLKCGAAGG